MKRSPTLPPLMLMVVFFGPMLLAVLLYHGPREWVRESVSAHGQLIDPPLALPAGALTTSSGGKTPPDWFRHRWSLLYARTSPCGDPCLETVEGLGRLRLAVGRDARRVQLVLLLADEWQQPAAWEALIVARTDDAAGTAIVERLGAPRLHDGRFYIVDPRGDVILTYPPHADRKGMLDDLKRLLRVSKIG